MELQTQRFASWRAIGNTEGAPSALNLGRTAEARQSLQKAIEVGEMMLARFGEEPQRLSAVALAHIELGCVLLEMNLTGDAEREFLRAEALAHPDHAPVGQDAAVEAMAQKSRLLVYRGKQEEALALRARVVEGRRALFQQNPRYQRWGYGGSLCSYGELLREMGRFPEAEAAYASALPIIEDLARIQPFDLHTQWNLARQYEEYAKVLLTLGRSPAAVGYLDRAIAIYRAIAQREPAAMSNQRSLAGCLSLRAGETWKQGDRSQADRQFQEALQLSADAARHDSASVRAQQELEAIRNVMAARHLI